MPPLEMRYARKCRSNWDCYYFMFKKKTVKLFFQCHVFAQSPPGRRYSDKFPVQSNFRTSPDLCKHVSLQCYLVATVIHINPYKAKYVCTYAYSLIQRCCSDKRNEKE